MKIFAIMLVKNEADVVKYSILDAKRWADRIFVMDNGSTDGTWQIVQSLADEIVVPWKQDPQPFYDKLRSVVFNQFRHEAQEGDWWCCNLDADEFYLDDPRDFLAKVPKKYGLVGRKALNFVLTKEDVENYCFTGDFEKDREHINKIEKMTFIERRFFRYKKSLKWDSKSPLHTLRRAGRVCPEYILQKHYPWRSPTQIQVRASTRMAVAQNTDNLIWGNYYSSEKVWQDYLRKSEDCIVVDSDETLRKIASQLSEHSVFKLPIRKIIKGTLKSCSLMARGVINPKQTKR